MQPFLARFRHREVRTLRIRTHLVVTAAAILLPLVLAGGAAIERIVRQEREAALRGLAETARATALLVDREVFSAVSTLRALALSEHLAQGDMRAFHARASAVVDGLPDRWVVLTDAWGREIVNTAVDYRAPPSEPRPGAPAEAVRVLTSGQPEVTDGLVDPETGRSVTLVQLPLPAASGMHGVLSLAIATSHWERSTLGGQLPDGWMAGMADRQGRVISRSRAARAAAGRPASAVIMKAAAEQPSGVLQTVSVESVPVYAAFTRSEATGWTVSVNAPKALIEQPARRALWMALAGLVLTAAIGVMSVSGFGRRLTRELAEAGRAARELGMGLRPRMKPSRVHEIASLKASIDEAAGLLQHERHSRSAAEDAMLQVEQRLVGIVRTARDAIIITDGHQDVVLYNDAAQAMFGRPRELVLGRGIQHLLPAECWTRFLDQTRALNHGEPDRIADRLLVTGRRPGGAELRMDCSISRLSDPQGESFYTVIVRDVTQRVRDQEALVRAHEELRQATQRYQRALMTEVEAGQARVAQELHDSVGSALAGILLLLRVARDRAAEPSLKLLLQKANEQLADSAEALRKISRGIMPVGSEAGGLLKALELYAHDLSSYKGIACTVRARGGFDCVPPDVGTHLYRIVQEAASNSVRHGGATMLRIRLLQGERLCRLCVLDDGSGCALDAMTGGRVGMGLRSMQVRAQAVGGRLTVTNIPGGGCRVCVCWPREATGTVLSEPAPLEHAA